MRASELAYQSRGDYQADYLTVEHNTVVDLRDEFILLGRETDTGKVPNYILPYPTSHRLLCPSRQTVTNKQQEARRL